MASKKDKVAVLRSRQELIDDLIGNIRKKHGVGVIGPAEDFMMPWLRHRRPTGLISLDLAIGGGIPAGSIIQLMGADGSYKTGLANTIIAMNQQVYGDEAAVFIAMTEHRYDKEYARMCGVAVAFADEEIMEMELARGAEFTKEEIAELKHQVGVITEESEPTAEKLLDIVHDQFASNLYQIGVIDSIGAYANEATITSSVGDKTYGGNAMTHTHFMHKIHPLLTSTAKGEKANRTTLILINQMRDNINAGPYGKTWKASGGWALKHGKALDILLKRVGKVKKGDEIIGHQIGWEILKGKCGCHEGGTGTFVYYHNKGIDLRRDLLDTAVEYGLVEKSGAWYSYGDERLGQGAEDAAATLTSDMMVALRTAIYKEAGINVIYKEGT